MPSTLYLQTQSCDPAYNLAFEEYVLQHYRQGNILILWQNDRSVIVGRNQNAAEEINQGFTQAKGIKVVRRNTGGGTVYHDLGNLNYSFITDADGVDKETTRLFLTPVVEALQSLGLEAQASGRNDILVSGRKVSGTAQQLSKGRLLHHGTLLFDSDPGMIQGALNPDPTKFQSKSVKSVRSRVGNIRDFLKVDMDMRAFWDYLMKHLTAGEMQEYALSDSELQEIRALKAQKYDTWEWNFGKSPKYDMANRIRWDGGLVDVRLSVSAGMITDLHIFGDFLALQPLEELESRLTGCPYQRSALEEALQNFPVEAYLGSVSRKELLDTILNEK